jgi:phytoene/squalene synthetase
MQLGSAFQKINFLRDFEADVLGLGRTYFPNINFNYFSEEQKQTLITEIEKEFKEAYLGIKKLPSSSKLGVYIAYVYYFQLLLKIKNTPVVKLKQSRIRIANNHKLFLFLQSYIKYNLNLA